MICGVHVMLRNESLTIGVMIIISDQIFRREYSLGFVFIRRFYRTYSEAGGELLKVLFLVYRVLVTRTKEVVEHINVVAWYFWHVIFIFTDHALKFRIIFFTNLIALTVNYIRDDGVSGTCTCNPEKVNIFKILHLS